ncbi:DUF4199 domain-containing protein [uncultured Pontibacter sp.]|uniref:DUF4199 domain-containing protein n=1 Tax=uncultured Pontibacter sp. TaxID=453356 RepID=UPI002636D9A0|nr:DUF4199 domain-containing protein [uncultured Pontibacter sp.]
MMKNYRIELKWAIVFVLMTLTWMVIEKLAGMHSTHIDKHAIFTNLIAIPAITVYVLALRDKRQNFYKGTMSYKQSFVSGLIITLLVTAISPLTQVIVSEAIAPEYFPNMILYAVTEGNMTQEAAEAYFNLKSYIVQGLIGAPLMGLLTTALVALFTKSKTKKQLVAA